MLKIKSDLYFDSITIAKSLVLLALLSISFSLSNDHSFKLFYLNW